MSDDVEGKISCIRFVRKRSMHDLMVPLLPDIHNDYGTYNNDDNDDVISINSSDFDDEEYDADIDTDTEYNDDVQPSHVKNMIDYHSKRIIEIMNLSTKKKPTASLPSLPPLPKLPKPRVIITRHKIACPSCPSEFYTEVALNEHFINNHTSIDDKLKCFRCGLMFDDEDDFEYHYETCDVPGDVIPTSSNGAYECPSCGNKYTTSNMLGEHFTLSHSSFNDNSALDDNAQYNYPGIGALVTLGMVTPHMGKISCPVCITDTDINYSYTCCNKAVCIDCIRETSEYRSCTRCMFCNRDHEKDTGDYMVTYELNDSIHSSWYIWVLSNCPSLVHERRDPCGQNQCREVLEPLIDTTTGQEGHQVTEI